MALSAAWLLHPKRLVGSCCILGVVILFCVSGELKQYILDSNSFPRPMFMAFFASSIMSLFLLGFFSNTEWQSGLRLSWKRLTASDPVDAETSLKSPVERVHPLPHEVLSMACWCAPISLFADYSRNLGICYSCGAGTTVATNTVLVSTTAFWALIIAIALGDERSTVLKFAAVALGVVGAVLVTNLVNTNEGDATSTLAGELLSLLSAILYGLYSVQLKRVLPIHGDVDVTMLMGFVGLVRAMVALVCLVPLHVTGIEVHESISKQVVICLLASGTLGTVIQNVLWTHSIALTSPLLTNLGTSLQIPVSFAADAINPLARTAVFTWDYVVGTLLIFGSFLVVAADPEQDAAPAPPSEGDGEAEEGRSR